MNPSDLTISDFDYDLPPDRIAQQPARPRDASRLLVLDRASGATSHRTFRDLPDLLVPGDLLVVNDTRVIPAAFTATRATGSRIEGCFLRAIDAGLWEVLLAGRGRLKVGERLSLVDAAGCPRHEVELVGRGEGGTWTVRPPAGTDALAILALVGRPPLPPYIHREDAGGSDADRGDYQTIYAARDGAVAAPTAGLHFTPEVLARLAGRGIERVTLTLHVGLGTFQPVRVERLADHRMHAEYVEVSAESAERINLARAAGRRIVAVGTTTVRALESAALGAVPFSGQGAVPFSGQGAVPFSGFSEKGTAPLSSGKGDSPHFAKARNGYSPLVRPMSGWTSIFIRPPYEFRAVDALLTNFHLPRTTLLVLVSALAGRERVLAAYAEAVRAGYRFYSYGDAMLIV
jgi:S-adenosylmethionine:tRNA ribosyltransferase-isomerase